MGDRTERHRDLDRYLTLVDAIVAIAITLLVLPLVELTGQVAHGESVAGLLRAHQALVWSFLLSFVVILRLWFAQHGAVRTVLLPHPAVLRLLALWTLGVVFLPFPTALVAEAGDQAITKVLYIGTIGVSLLLIAVLERVVAAHPEITTGRDAPAAEGALVNAGLAFTALAVTLAFPVTSYLPMLLLALDTPILRMLSRRR